MTTQPQPQVVEIKRPTLSPSALSNYEICGRRGQFYQSPNVDRKTGWRQAVGSSFHRFVEHYYKARMAGQITGIDDVGSTDIAVWGDDALALFENITAGADYVTHPDDPTIGEGVATLTVLATAWVEAEPGVRWEDDDLEVVAVESELLYDFGSEHHLFHGYADLALQRGSDGTVILQDTKTTSRRWGGSKAEGDLRQLGQAPLYAEAYAARFGAVVNHFAYDVFTLKGQHQRVWADVSEARRIPYVSKWWEMSQSIHLHEAAGIDMPTNTNHFLCSEKWCDYWDICPMGAAAEPADK